MNQMLDGKDSHLSSKQQSNVFSSNLEAKNITAVSPESLNKEKADRIMTGDKDTAQEHDTLDREDGE